MKSREYLDDIQGAQRIEGSLAALAGALAAELRQCRDGQRGAARGISVLRKGCTAGTGEFL
jgi:hypothetical protein